MNKKIPLVLAAGLALLACIGYVLFADPSLRAAFDDGRIAGGGPAAAAVLVVGLAGLAGAIRVAARRRHGTLRDPAVQLRLFSEGLKDSAIFMLGPDGRIALWSSSSEQLLGHDAREVRDRHFSALFSDEDARLGKPERCLHSAEEFGRFEQRVHLARTDGSAVQVYLVITPVRSLSGALDGFSVVTRDVTELAEAEDLVTKLSLTVELTANLIVISTPEGKVEFVNRAVEEVTGFTRSEFTAAGLDVLRIREQDERTYRMMRETAFSGEPYQAEIAALNKGGEPLFLDGVVTPVSDGTGRVTSVVFTARDITPLRLMRDKIDFLASYDPLTCLPNREIFTDRLGRDLGGGHPIAVLALDIDRFKYLNEIYGIEAANNVLKQVAESLSVSVGKGDTVGRLGSDEFGVVLHDIKRPADVVLFVKMIMKNIPQIVMSGGQEIAVTLAAGIALFPNDAIDAATLMKNADMALAKAKDLGRNRYQFYTSDMNVGVSELVFMERRLTDALKNTEYVLTFQPYCHLSNGKVAGAEALLKWNNAEFGQVSPAKFIPLLEETGMIIDVGKWVLHTACRQIRQWTNGTASPPLSVNLSPFQFRHDYLVETVRDAIRDAGIDPRLLVLEITESIFMKDQEFAIAVLKRLKEIGVALSIDDFGTGYSSLSYLKRFPVDFVKIDQSFVADVAVDPDATSLVTAIISMAHSLGLKTIAEGVESEEQWKLLRLLKCDMAQGFHFSPAVTAKDFEQYLP